MAEHTEGESGVILVLSAMSLVLILGIAAFAVDLGWIAYNQLEARKTAEAGALAGVVHMPLPGCVDPAAGTAPFDTAVNTAGRNGYTAARGDSVAAAAGGSCYRLSVTVSRTIPTFFMKVFGYNSLTVSESATAEQLPPLKIGGDQPNLGNENLSDSEGFWVAIRGTGDPTGYGDPWTPVGIPHYYAVDVPEGSTGTLLVDIFDGINHQRSCSGPAVSPLFPCEPRYLETGDNDTSNFGSLQFTLYGPDSTPNSWTDNTDVVCARSFGNTLDYADPLVNDATSLINSATGTFDCGSAVSGIHVLKVVHSSNNNNNYGISSTTAGDQPAVYGLGSMTIYMNELNTAPKVQVVRVDGGYAGTQLVISMFDAGDVSIPGFGSATMEFTGAFAGMDCLAQTRSVGSTSGSGYTSDSTFPGGLGSSACGITVKNSSVDYGNEWVDFQFTIPADYSCDSDVEDCWGTVQFTFPPGVYPWDTTTWTGTLNGTPVHLVP